MLNLHTIVKATDDYIKEMKWKNADEFCNDLGISKFELGIRVWPGEPFSINCSKEIEKELLTGKKKIAVSFIVHGRLYVENVISYKLGNCIVITDKEFEKLF